MNLEVELPVILSPLMTKWLVQYKMDVIKEITTLGLFHWDFRPNKRKPEKPRRVPRFGESTKLKESVRSYGIYFLEIDDKTLDKIEEYLIQSDVGIIAAAEIKEIISDSKIDPKKDIAEEINTILKEYIVSLMKPLENDNFFKKKDKINATLVSGVNGVGKTTTIGKISKILKANGNKVMLAASDTFRAAAIEQLENWANKVEVDITKSSQGADPASVAYKAIEEAINNNFNQVLIDTAGRLQNKKNLMEEYKKIANVTKKIDPEAPHDVILVLDATSGQNVINQVEEFNKIIPITGLVMTKLDGTAKGGILLAVAKKYKLPIIALGLGETEDDLQIFEAEKFAEAFTQIS